MNEGWSSLCASRTSATRLGGIALAAISLAAAALNAQAQTSRQPLDGPNVAMNRDLTAGSLVDSLIDPLADGGTVSNAAHKALGGKPSRASQRPQWTARLARNPNPGDGNPAYVLIDRYGGIQRYVEESPTVDLEKYLGQSVSVRRDTGHTLLATQLDLPRTARRTTAAGSKTNANNGVQLAAFEEMPEPTPADEPPSPTAEPLPSGEIVEGNVIEGPMLDEQQGRPLVIPDGVDPLYLDSDMHGDGLHFDGCDMCGSKLCKMQGGCGYGSRPVLSVRGEYLLWWADGMPIPPLVVRGEVNDSGTPADPTDDFFDNAFVVYGNQDILDEARSGGRVTVTYWLDDYGRYALEGDYFGFGQVESHFVDGGDGTFPIVGRPFFDILNGIDSVQLVSFPGLQGTVTVDADSTFQSAGVRLRRNLCCTSGGNTDCGDAVTCGSGVCGPLGCGAGVGGEAPCLQIFRRGTRHVDVSYGARWAQLDEGLNIREDLEVIAPSPPADIGTTFLVNDNFSTSNDFIGGEIGFLYDWQYKRFSIEFLSRLAIGRTRQRVAINGFTVNTPPGGPAETGVGGLLTQTSNIGEYERNELSVLPQLGFTAGYNVTDRLKLVGGYTFVYWSRVVRPGDQIDLDVNTELLPFNPTPGDGLPARPQFVFRDTDFWAHGVSAGIEYMW